MPRVCLTCRHPEREAIDQAVLGGRADLEIAAEYGVSSHSIRRHRLAHIAQLMARAIEVRDSVNGSLLLAQVHALHDKALALLAKAEAAGDYRGALQGIREARGCIELLARLLGELDESPKVAILLSPEWATVRALLMTALAPFPEARAAVAGRLLLLEAGHGAR